MRILNAKGLFVGLSFMSFYELFEMLFTIGYIGLASMLGRKKFKTGDRNNEISTGNLLPLP
jgi:hypothetical protein